MSQRRTLSYANIDAVAADVRALRDGNEKSGSWNLPQTCWHLDTALGYGMRPGPHTPVKKTFMKWLMLKTILTVGRIPGGVKGPDRIMPAMDVPEHAIDDFLASLEKLKAYRGDFAPHPMFGPMSPVQYVRLFLIHSAHHFGLLRPVATPNRLEAKCSPKS